MNSIEDMSEEEKIIVEEDKLASMNEMIRNIAHQWRQPLSQINSTISIIDDILYEKNIQDPLLEAKLKEIESLTKYMSNTIDDFNDFSQKKKIKSQFFLSEIIKKSIEITDITLKENDIELAVDIDKEFLCIGYENELHQVLVILLNNSIDALVNRNTHQAKIEISLLKDESNYIIRVSDNAGSMTKSIMKKIFEPYFTTKHKSQGTGLGLYMSRKIIQEKFNGSLSVKNLKNGVCFEILLECNIRV